MTARDVPVLIVGAGPVGMMAALCLARLGVRSHVVDRRPGPHRAPQAHVANPRTLEICRTLGLDRETLRAHATPREDGGQVVWMTCLAGEEIGRMPYERQGDDAFAWTPTPLLNLPQHRFEPLLVERLGREPRVSLSWRHEWEALAEDTDGVSAHIRDLESGGTSEVRSRWLLAADGAGSRIRRALGTEMIGPDSLQSFVMIHFEANLRPIVRERPAMLYWMVDPACTGVFVAHDIERSWVFMHPFDPETETMDSYTPETCTAIVARAIGRTVDVRLHDISRWTMTAQIAARWGTPRVRLLGDSAHRFPPAGGLGMNTGIQDAHNLAWKLAAVEAGWAERALLDTYETERRPVAQRNSDQSLENVLRMTLVFEALGLTPGGMGSSEDVARTLGDPAGRAAVEAAIARQADHFDMLGLQLGFAYEDGALVPDGSPGREPANAVRDVLPTTRPGARLPHAWIVRDGARLSTLDLVPYEGFTILAGEAGSAWVAAAQAVAGVPVRCLVAGRDFADPEGAWASLSETAPGGALLVRPDQHVAWRCATAPADPRRALAAALHAVLGARPGAG